jgi:hypothetical protein
MKYTPRSLEDLAADRLWPEAVYPFSVKSAEEATSKTSGKEMIVLELCIYSDDGKMKVVKDYLVEDQLEKLAQFCRFSGIEELYNSGNVTALDMENREGYVKIKQEKPKPGSDFAPKNAVAWYCPKPKDRDDAKDIEARRIALEKGFKEAGATAGGPDGEDEIPF